MLYVSSCFNVKSCRPVEVNCGNGTAAKSEYNECHFLNGSLQATGRGLASVL